MMAQYPSVPPPLPLKENPLPSYLRGTASSNNRAESTRSRTKPKSTKVTPRPLKPRPKYKTDSNASLASHDLEILESLLREIPTEFINMDDGLFKLPSQKLSNQSLALLKRRLFVPVLPSVGDPEPRRKVSGPTPNTSFDSSDLPLRLRPPSVKLRKSETAIMLDRKNVSSFSLSLNQPQKPASISGLRKSATQSALRPPSVLIPSKRVDNSSNLVLKRANNSASSLEKELSFLKEYSFDSDMSHMFDDLNLVGFQTDVVLSGDDETAKLKEKDAKSKEDEFKSKKLKPKAEAKLKTASKLNKTSKISKQRASSKHIDTAKAPSTDNHSQNTTTSKSHSSNIRITAHPVPSKTSLDATKSRKSSQILPSYTAVAPEDSNGGCSDNLESTACLLLGLEGLGKMRHSPEPSTSSRATTRPGRLAKAITGLRKQTPTKTPGRIMCVEELEAALMECKDTRRLIRGWKREKPRTVAASSPMRSSDWVEGNQWNLNAYEKGELLRKDSIYFVRAEGVQPRAIELTNYKCNFGFDDAHQNYVAVVGDHIDYRYEILAELGKGSFGSVLRCRDHKTGKAVALKVIKNDSQWAFQAVCEIRVLKDLCSTEGAAECAPSILEYQDHFSFRGHMCIVTELLLVDLFQAVLALGYAGFSLPMVSLWARQVFVALEYIHSKNIIHCDLKPENIMFSDPSMMEVKVIDFGSACYVGETTYSYIQSRFYRAPEVLLGARYGTAVDVWSAGCVFAEMYTGEPLLGGKNEAQQLALAVELLGVPKRRVIQKLREELREKGQIDKAEVKTLLETSFDCHGGLKPLALSPDGKKKYVPSSRALESALYGKDHKRHMRQGLGLSRVSGKYRLTELEVSFADFIQLCLEWDPFARAQAKDLLHHGFLRVDG